VKRKRVIAAVLAVCMMVPLSAPALAAAQSKGKGGKSATCQLADISQGGNTSQAEQIGKNVGHLIIVWAAAVFLGVVASVGIVHLLNRRHAELGSFAVVAIMVGGPVFAAPIVAGIIFAIWNAVASGVC
jgi:hypothetical protein